VLVTCPWLSVLVTEEHTVTRYLMMYTKKKVEMVRKTGFSDTHIRSGDFSVEPDGQLPKPVLSSILLVLLLGQHVLTLAGLSLSRVNL
jgi:hypothetical protein